MISLKRLNGTSFYLNAELIEQIEKTPDTVITLTTGNNIVVKNDLDEVIHMIVDYKKMIASPYAKASGDKGRRLLKILKRARG